MTENEKGVKEFAEDFDNKIVSLYSKALEFTGHERLMIVGSVFSLILLEDNYSIQDALAAWLSSHSHITALKPHYDNLMDIIRDAKENQS